MQGVSLQCTHSLVVALQLSCSAACGILVPQPGFEPASLAMWIPNHQGSTRLPPFFSFFYSWALAEDVKSSLHSLGVTCAFDTHTIFSQYVACLFVNDCCHSVAQLCPTLCDPMDCSTPGLPFVHCLLEFAQTHVHWVDDAFQPSHSLSPPSPPALNLSPHQCLF